MRIDLPDSLLPALQKLTHDEIAQLMAWFVASFQDQFEARDAICERREAHAFAMLERAKDLMDEADPSQMETRDPPAWLDS